jgi:hypothetical protein
MRRANVQGKFSSHSNVLRKASLARSRWFLRYNVLHVNPLDGSVELERHLVKVIKRHRRTVGNADVEAVVACEEQRRGYRHLACRNHFAVHLHGDVERSSGLEHCVGRLDFDLHLADRELLLGADLRALDDEEVVLVTENAVLHEAG